MNKSSKRLKQANRHRQFLIDATLDSIAEIGIARTSVSEIIQRANLSRGMIHLHFGSKDHLLVAAVKKYAEYYYQHLDQYLENAGTSAQHRLEAIVCYDLDESVLNKWSINIWCAFRGESRERKEIATYTGTRDEKLKHLMYRAFREIADSYSIGDGSSLLAQDATHGTQAILEGMWTDYSLHPDAFDRSVAKRIVFRFLASLFPRHFDLDGAKCEYNP